MNREKTIYNRIIKRILDVICSFMAIVFLSIVYLPICVVIKCTSKGPIFFKQKRIGKDKKYFNILKFRTMRIDTPKDCPTHLLKNPKQYITKVGKFLRKTSLDELPQIFNIFKGDSGIIGTTKKNLDFTGGFAGLVESGYDDFSVWLCRLSREIMYI